MKSIRLYLLLALLATITLVNFISLLDGYSSSIDKAHQIFDQRLQNLNRLIAEANNTSEVSSDKATERSTSNLVFFQIWDQSGQSLINTSSSAPDVLLGELKHGFDDANYQHYRWRIYTEYYEADAHWVVVGERSDISYTLAESVALESVHPIVLGIPIMALIIWFAIGLGLKPLRKLSSQLEHKEAHDLTPISLEPIPNELTQLVASTNDLLTRLERAFQREQRFSSDAAHELRTPISVLKVHLHNLKTTIGDKNSDIELLEEGLDRLGHLIEQILALYRTSPETVHDKVQSLDLFSLVQQLIADLYQKFDEKQQSIELLGEGAFIQGIPFAVETLVINLLENANKYTPIQGRIIVTVDDTKMGVNLIVEDSGVGVPEGSYDRIFERFYRVGGDQHNSGEVGCGLGLAIVKHIVDMHKATITLAQSRFESGLKVTIHFPHELGNK